MYFDCNCRKIRRPLIRCSDRGSVANELPLQSHHTSRSDTDSLCSALSIDSNPSWIFATSDSNALWKTFDDVAHSAVHRYPSTNSSNTTSTSLNVISSRWNLFITHLRSVSRLKSSSSFLSSRDKGTKSITFSTSTLLIY